MKNGLYTFLPLLAGLTGFLSVMAEDPKSGASGATPKHELATFGGGCFWCTEAVFEKLPGVVAVVSGYSGGQTPNPTYKEICTGETGHAEVIQIEFDPAKISYDALLDAFWQAHDPTTLNRQGADRGTQYRSIILYHSPEQHAAALRSKELANAREFNGKITTEIVPLKKFFPAEDYHQDYFRKNPNQPYCQAVIAPKLFKLEKKGVVPK
jgi:peptide-methionine (S)-S-oxide reductase